MFCDSSPVYIICLEWKKHGSIEFKTKDFGRKWNWNASLNYFWKSYVILKPVVRFKAMVLNVISGIARYWKTCTLWDDWLIFTFLAYYTSPFVFTEISNNCTLPCLTRAPFCHSHVFIIQWDNWGNWMILLLILTFNCRKIFILYVLNCNVFLNSISSQLILQYTSVPEPDWHYLRC